MTASHHHEALSQGIKRWIDFVSSCLRAEGPAGVHRQGASDYGASVRLEAKAWSVNGKSTFDVGRMLGFTRLELSNSHADGVGILLAAGSPMPPIAALTRAWVEASARAFWLLDPSVSVRTLIARGLTECLEEVKILERMRRERNAFSNASPTQGFSTEEIRNLATAAGLDLEFNRKSHFIGVEGSRPSTMQLLKDLEADSPWVPLPDLVPNTFRRQSAAVHGNLLSWGQQVAMGGHHASEPASVRLLVWELAYAMHLHGRAFDAWTAAFDWIPNGLFVEARRISLNPFGLSVLEIMREQKS